MIAHGEAARRRRRRRRRHETGGLERREGAGCLDGGGAGGGGGVLLRVVVQLLAAPAAAEVAAAVMAQVLADHEAALVGAAAAAGVEAAGVVVPRVRAHPLVLFHEMVAVAAVADVHLGPVVLRRARQAAKMATAAAHGRCRAVIGRGAARHNRRPFVGAVRVLLHVLGQVGLLGVALTAIGADVGLQVLGLLVLGDVV